MELESANPYAGAIARLDSEEAEPASLGPDPAKTIETEAEKFGLKKTSGKRSREEQERLVRQGKTTARNSYHLYEGNSGALDFSGDPEKMREFTQHLRDTYGDQLPELFHGDLAWKNGRRIPAVHGHQDHAHVAWGQLKNPYQKAIERIQKGGDATETLQSPGSNVVPGAASGQNTLNRTESPLEPFFGVPGVYAAGYAPTNAPQPAPATTAPPSTARPDSRTALRSAGNPYSAALSRLGLSSGATATGERPKPSPKPQPRDITPQEEEQRQAFEADKKAGNLMGARQRGHQMAEHMGWEYGEKDGWPYIKPPAHVNPYRTATGSKEVAIGDKTLQGAAKQGKGEPPQLSILQRAGRVAESFAENFGIQIPHSWAQAGEEAVKLGREHTPVGQVVDAVLSFSKGDLQGIREGMEHSLFAMAPGTGEVSNILKSHGRKLKAGYDQWVKEGAPDVPSYETTKHILAGAVPIFGPPAKRALDQLEKGDYEGAAGTALALVAIAFGPKVLKAARGVEFEGAAAREGAALSEELGAHRVNLLGDETGGFEPTPAETAAKGVGPGPGSEPGYGPVTERVEPGPAPEKGLGPRDPTQRFRDLETGLWEDEATATQAKSLGRATGPVRDLEDAPTPIYSEPPSPGAATHTVQMVDAATGQIISREVESSVSPADAYWDSILARAQRLERTEGQGLLKAVTESARRQGFPAERMPGETVRESIAGLADRIKNLYEKAADRLGVKAERLTSADLGRAATELLRTKGGDEVERSQRSRATLREESTARTAQEEKTQSRGAESTEGTKTKESEVTPDATKTGEESESRIIEHPRATSRGDLRPDEAEVGEGESRQAGRRDRPGTEAAVGTQEALTTPTQRGGERVERQADERASEDQASRAQRGRASVEGESATGQTDQRPRPLRVTPTGAEGATEGRIVSETPARVPGIQGIVSRERQERRRVEGEAAVDKLTGLQSQSQWLAARPRIEADPNLHITRLDINSLKQVNDAHGHAAGDSYISAVAKIVQEEARNAGIPDRMQFRSGQGDEFTLAGTAADLRKVAGVIQSRVQREVGLPDGTKGSVAVGTGAKEKIADDLMYRDKERGKRAEERGSMRPPGKSEGPTTTREFPNWKELQRQHAAQRVPKFRKPVAGEMPDRTVTRQGREFVTPDGKRFSGQGAKREAERYAQAKSYEGALVTSYGGGADIVEKVDPDATLGGTYQVRDAQSGRRRSHSTEITDSEVIAWGPRTVRPETVEPKTAETPSKQSVAAWKSAHPADAETLSGIAKSLGATDPVSRVNKVIADLISEGVESPTEEELGRRMTETFKGRAPVKEMSYRPPESDKATLQAASAGIALEHKAWQDAVSQIEGGETSAGAIQKLRAAGDALGLSPATVNRIEDLAKETASETQTRTAPEATPAGRQTGGGEVPATRQPTGAVARGKETRVRIPGKAKAYAARYQVQELSDIYPSHNPVTFQANPDYHFVNDRDYSNPLNQSRVIENAQAGKFEPAYLVTDTPTASDGPPVIDQAGNVLGGNNRTMTLARVYSDNPEGAKAYRDLLTRNFRNFGLDLRQLQGMNQPVLVRVLHDADIEAQAAITELNVVGTAALTQSEQAIADARRIPESAIDYISTKIDNLGEEGTLAKVMERKAGVDVVNRLISEGVFTEQERPRLIDDRGLVTKDAKDRVGRLLIGRVFRDLDQLENTSQDIRNKLERIIAPLVRVSNNPAWDLTNTVNGAVDALREAKAHGIKNLDDLARQQTMFGPGAYSPAEMAIAKKLQEGPIKAAKAFRGYAQDEANARVGQGTLLGPPPDQRESFAAHFDLEEPNYQAFEDAIREDIPRVRQMPAEDYNRVVAKLEAIKRQAKADRQPLSVAIQDFLDQKGLFGGEFNEDQASLLRELATRGRRAAQNAEQGTLFDSSPTLDSETEKRVQADRGMLFPIGGLFENVADQTESSEFKRWFRDSKVVDEQGKPLVVYHGTPTRGSESNNRYVRSEQADVEYPSFDVFNTTDGGMTDSQWLGEGAYFTPDADYAWEFGNYIMPVYLSIKRPFEIIDDSSNSRANQFRFLQSIQSLKGLPDKFKLDLSVPKPRSFETYRGETVTEHYSIDEVTKPKSPSERFYLISTTHPATPGGIVEGKGATRDEAVFNYRYKDEFRGFLLHTISRDIGSREFRHLLQGNGYDGVIERREERGLPAEIVAFHPQQIKSAIGNRGTFDPFDPNILHDVTPRDLGEVQAAPIEPAQFAWRDRRGYLAMNAGATRALTQAYGRPLRGLAMNQATALSVITKARLAARDATGLEKDNLDSLADAINYAAGRRSEFSLVTTAAGRTRSTIRHESAHVAQIALERFYKAAPAESEVYNIPNYKAAAEGMIERRGYTWIQNNPRAVAHEAAAHIAGGQWEDLGMTRDEATDFLAGYFELISRTYNRPEALKVFDQLNNSFKELRDGVIARERERRTAARGAAGPTEGRVQSVSARGERGTEQASSFENIGFRERLNREFGIESQAFELPKIGPLTVQHLEQLESAWDSLKPEQQQAAIKRVEAAAREQTQQGERIARNCQERGGRYSILD